MTGLVGTYIAISYERSSHPITGCRYAKIERHSDESESRQICSVLLIEEKKFLFRRWTDKSG